MKHIIILGDGMADHPIARLGGKTPLQYARTPHMDTLAREGRCGTLRTVPDGFHPGSEVANTAILGYDLGRVYEGRGPLEAASIGYDMRPGDLALRCNIITLADGRILTHNGGNLQTADADKLVRYLDEHLGTDRVHFITGIQYRHLLIIRGGSKHIVCAPPHDHPDEPWRPLLVKAEPHAPDDSELTAAATADLLNDLILRSQELLAAHPYNVARVASGQRPANSIWPWGGGYRPAMPTLQQTFPQMRRGSVISAVDLIRGIGRYAGLDIVTVEGATGLSDTNYEGKAAAALAALRDQDFVFVHVEASDEAGHDGDLDLKLRTIENLDSRLVGPIAAEIATWQEPVALAVLPDHPTPVEVRTHVAEPVPFVIHAPGLEPDTVEQFDETACSRGAYGALERDQFIRALMAL